MRKSRQLGRLKHVFRIAIIERHKVSSVYQLSITKLLLLSPSQLDSFETTARTCSLVLNFATWVFPEIRGRISQAFKSLLCCRVNHANQTTSWCTKWKHHLCNCLEVQIIILSMLAVDFALSVNCERGLTLQRVFQCWVQECSGGPTEESHPEKNRWW